MITRERLKGGYSEGEALAIYMEVKGANDFRNFATQFMHDEDPELRSELVRAVKDIETEYYKPAVISVRKRILSGKLTHYASHRTPKARNQSE